ncbi:MAG: SLC45 family MFS transporter [Lachnoclostridium sp.]|nr:SLC45 family MFS transporter [Lachnoclostridium sp.]
MKLNYRRTILIGLAFLSISAFWQMYDNVVPLILKNSFGLGETVTGAIMAADNVLALFLLPIFGSLSDKVDTPIGKRMPFILGGTALAVTFLMMVPYADQSRNLPMFVISLFALLISMGLYRSPAVALMPDLTPKPLRSAGNAVINLMGAVGGVYTLIMIKVMVGPGETPNYYPLFISVGALMVIGVGVLFLTIKEKKLREEIAKQHEAYEAAVDTKTAGTDKNSAGSTALPKDVKRSLTFILISIALWFTAYNAVTTAFSRYATHVWGLENGGYADCLMVATVAAIISYIPIGALSGKIGRKKTIQIGIVLLMLCYASAGMFHSYHAVMNIFFGIIGFAWAAINVNSLPMVVEMSNAGDVGKYTGLYYTFSMSAQVITPILSGYLLEHISYRTLFPYAVVFSAMAFVTMSMVKHGDSRPAAKKSMLENFDVED